MRDDEMAEGAPQPELVAEWRIILVLPGGIVRERGHDSEKSARTAALRMAEANTNATWTIERRLVTAWEPVSTPVQIVERHPTETTAE